MSNSGQSSAFNEYDLHLSSLTVGEFKQEIEINGRVLRWLQVKVQIGVGVRRLSLTMRYWLKIMHDEHVAVDLHRPFEKMELLFYRQMYVLQVLMLMEM
uniref:Uncharacterized protein n=1 Tax=Acrobeloides nanus TaxID=290746 RepID=A0A914EFV7_9BILA